MFLFSVGDESESEINSYEKDSINNYIKDENHDLNVDSEEMNNIQEFHDQNLECSLICFGRSENLLGRYSNRNENIQESCTFDDQNSVFSCISSVADYHSFAGEDYDFDESHEINDKMETLKCHSENNVDFFSTSKIFKFENGSKICHDAELFKCPPTVKAWIQNIYRKKNDFEELENFKSNEYFTKENYHNEDDTKSVEASEAPMKNILLKVQEIIKNDKKVISAEFFKSGSYHNELDLEPSKCSPSVRTWIENILFKNVDRVNKDEVIVNSDAESVNDAEEINTASGGIVNINVNKDEAIVYSDTESVNDAEEINNSTGGIVNVDDKINFGLLACRKNEEYFTKGPEFFGLRKRRNGGY